MNGVILDETEAKISIYDSALMFGDMVFEMTRSFNGIQFKLEDHLDRLFNSMKCLRIRCPFSKEHIKNACLEVIEANKKEFGKDDEHRLMIDVSRGALSIYRDVHDIHMGCNLVISDFPLRWTVGGMGKLFDTGINAVIPSQRSVSAHLIDPKIKNRSRIHYQMANIEVSGYSGNNNWALLLDEDGYITEGTGDNFFIVKDKKVITPEGRNVLRGISREYVFELCESMSIECLEKNIGTYDVYTADEAFMTGTPFCILPVTSLNGSKIDLGAFGNITKRILDKWSINVGVDIVSQIKNWENSNSGLSPYKFCDE